MGLKYVFFDLDGTLLPMDQEIFIKKYFGLLARKMLPHGYESDKFIRTIWESTKRMVMNNGEKTNEEVFWDHFKDVYGESAENDKSILDDFYRNEFLEVQSVLPCDPDAVAAVKKIKEMGLKTVLATNPLFPSMATEHRIRWAGFELDDFEFYTTYENSSTCKPNPAYYREVLERAGALPEESLMVGNDVQEDMIAEKLGMKVFLLPKMLINRDGTDISAYPCGDFNDLLNYIERIR